MRSRVLDTMGLGLLVGPVLLATPVGAETLPGTESVATVAAGTAADGEPTGAHDFDFLVGNWTIHNRRLVGRLRGSTQWDEFEATSEVRSQFGGMASLDTFRTEYWPNFEGLSLRFFDPATKRWAIYWVDGNTGVLQPPVWGAFENGIGLFEGPDELDGRPIVVRFVWSGTDSASPRWEQLFSPDGGATWESNWVMELERVAPARSSPGFK